MLFYHIPAGLCPSHPKYLIFRRGMLVHRDLTAQTLPLKHTDPAEIHDKNFL
jgi:hypothetical protein